jgi:hypothetical protein
MNEPRLTMTSLPNHLQFWPPLREPEDWTALCAADDCDVWRKASDMQQCRSCERNYCPACWPNDYSGDECVSCWSHRMAGMERRLREDLGDAIVDELVAGRAA